MESLHAVLDNVNLATAILALVVCVIFYAYIQWINMPPGPIGLPYLGYFPFLEHDCHLQLHKLSKKYGDVYCINFTGQMYLYLGSMQAIKEAHVTKSECFAARSKRVSALVDTLGGGMVFMNGEEWRDMRKFFLQKLRDVGFGKRTQETLLGDYLEKTVSTIRKTDGENFDAMAYFTTLSSKVIFAMLLGGACKIEDDDIKMYNEAYGLVTQTMIGRNGLLSGPLLSLMFHVHPGYKLYKKCKNFLDNMLARMVEEHEKDFDKDNIRDLVDCYIAKKRELEEKGDPKAKMYTAKVLQDSLIQFVGDGGFSIGVLIAHVLQVLNSHPEIQKEIQREIDNIVGRNRFPSWDDRSKMTYTNAVIQECCRKADFFPIFPSLECVKETTVGGCRVPKGTITLVGYWASFNDPDVYEDPKKFDPTRFLPSVDGKKPKADAPLLFGAGKRSCIGESVVIMEAFIFVTSILQNFDLHPAKESETEEAGTPSENNRPDDFKSVFRATPRAS